MNILNARIKRIKSTDGITHIYAQSGTNIFSSLLLSADQEYQEGQNVNLIFKETEVMIATKDSHVSSRNSFVSPIISIERGEILARVEFNLEGTEIVSIITKDALDDIGCKVDEEFMWFIKSNEVSIGVPS